MSSSDSHTIDTLNTIILYTFRYLTPVLYTVGNVGNILSTWVFFQKSWRKNVCVFYFLICLLFNAFFMNSTMLGSICVTGFNINLQNSSSFLCKIFYYVSFLMSMLFPTILILASIDRLLISSQNVDIRLYSSRRLAYFSVSLSTCFWTVFLFHALVKVNLQELYPSVFICYYDSSPIYRNFVAYSSAITGVILPLVMTVLTILTYKNVRRNRAAPRPQRNNIRSMHKKDFQLLRCLFVKGIVYIIFSVGVSIYPVYGIAVKPHVMTPLEQAVDNFISNFVSFLHFIPYCSCFFIYIGVSKAFRHELKRLFYKMCGKDLLPMRGGEPSARDNPELNVVVSCIVVQT